MTVEQFAALVFAVWVVGYYSADRLASRYRPNWRASNARLALALCTLAAFAALSVGNALAAIVRLAS